MNSSRPLNAPISRPGPTLGWGIIGTGVAATDWFIPTLRNLPLLDTGSRYPAPDSTALGVFSHSETRARAYADRCAIPHLFVNLADLLGHPAIHCVYIANHPRHHAQAALAALAAGKHVFCEYPLALSADEAEQITQTAFSRGLILGINFPQRADPSLRAARELLAEQAIGDLLGGRISQAGLLPPARQTWRLRPLGGGVLHDRASRSVDILRFLLRDEVDRIFCAASPHLLSEVVEEEVHSTLTLRRSGQVFHSHDSFLVSHLPNSLELYGSRGALVARHLFDNTQSGELWLHRHGQVTQIPTATIAPYAASLQAFTHAVRGQSPPLAGGPDAVHALRVIEAAQESLHRGQQIRLPTRLRPPTDRALP